MHAESDDSRGKCHGKATMATACGHALHGFFFIILFSINNLNNYRFLKKVSQIMNLCTTVPRHENSTDIF